MNDATHHSSSTDTLGHPRGLVTLFFTEMWERMSYYGMRALLVLFMTATLQDGGLAITVVSATAIYGLYTGAVYFMGLPGGWIADRLLGGQRAVWYGGIIIMIGHIVLAIPSDQTFFIGLVIVVLGTGLLKPNIGAMVGGLYASNDERRDSGFAIYYMGINIGSVIGNIVCGYLAVNQGWHWAFGAAAIGMAIGLIQYRLTTYKLEGVSAQPADPLSDKARNISWFIIGAALIVIAVITGLALSGQLIINPQVAAEYTAYIITSVFLLYFGYIFFMGKLSGNEKKSMLALLLICFASAFFWSGFEQAGSSMNLFARDYTDRMLGSFEIPTAWFQSLNSVFIILLTPFFAALWISLGRSLWNPSSAFKCAAGLLIMGSGFIAMFFAAEVAAKGLKVAPYWLILTYFLHTVGELCLSPIALSAVTKLSPRRFAGQLMGVFVLTYSIGNVIAGLMAGGYDPKNMETIPALYMQISMISIGAALLFMAISLKTKPWERLAENKAD